MIVEPNRDAHWTAINEVEHWGWAAFEFWCDQWLAALPDAHEAHDMDESDQACAFIQAHPDGWPSHPDCPRGLDGTEVRDLRLLEAA